MIQGAPSPLCLLQAIGSGGACAERPVLCYRPLPLPRSLVRVMASAAALEAVAPTGALCGLVHDFVMGQQEGPADQVAAGTADGAARLPRGGRLEGAASAQAPGGKRLRDSDDFERLFWGRL